MSTLFQGETDQVCIGNDIASVEAVRSSLRNQFDRSLVSNFTYQEQLLDYGFSHLGLHRQTAVRHPVVMTEPVCNPGYCRFGVYILTVVLIVLKELISLNPSPSPPPPLPTEVRCLSYCSRPIMCRVLPMV